MGNKNFKNNADWRVKSIHEVILIRWSDLWQAAAKMFPSWILTIV